MHIDIVAMFLGADCLKQSENRSISMHVLAVEVTYFEVVSINGLGRLGCSQSGPFIWSLKAGLSPDVLSGWS